MSNTGSDRLAYVDSHICPNCDRIFCRSRGLNQHLRSCYPKNKITDVQTPYERYKDDANTWRFKYWDFRYLSSITLIKIGQLSRLFVWEKFISGLRKNSILEEKYIFITIWRSRKKFHRWNFQTDNWVDTRVTFKRYRV